MPRKVAKKKTKARRAVAKLVAWSFSRLGVYRICPRMARYKFIDKLPDSRDQDSVALREGAEAHDYLQAAARGRPGKRRDLSWAVREIQAAMDKGDEYDTEVEYAYDPKWRRTDWLAKNVRCRVKADLTVYDYGKAGVTLVVDYKTGRKKPEEHQEQLWLYALATFLEDESTKKVVAEVWYTKTKDKLRETFNRRQVPELKRYWEEQTRAYLADRSFAPNPCGACRWCPYSKKKGGPCEY